METNNVHDPLTNPIQWKPDSGRTVYWNEPGLKVTRLRLLSDYGFSMWDVSYCWGVLPDGTKVDVSLPFSQLAKGKGYAADILAYAKADGVYAKGLQLFDPLVVSKLV